MTCLSPETQEPTRLQLKVCDAIDYIGDNFKAWLFGWIIISGALSSCLNDPGLIWYLAGIPVFLLMAIAFFVCGFAFISRILSL